jgi:hypothetical protein
MIDGSERRHRPRTVLGAALLGAVGLGLILAPGAAAEDIPYPHGEYEEDCSTCHSPQSWHPAAISDRFDHGRSSGFTLDGAHRTAMCRSCHLSLDFAQADNRCVSCHLDAHNGELGVDCAQCHSTSNFIDHADQVRSHRTTRFPLDGAHTTLDCLSCHPQQPSGALRFVNTPTECESCHLEAFMRTTEPNHVQLDFDRNCIGCHGTTTWNAVRFDSFDHTITGFPLVGAHRRLDCAQCHVGGGFAGADADCLTCHQPDFESTQSPNHVSGGFPTDCQQCHGAQGWTPAQFDHGLTGFALTGSHSGLTCEQCHAGGTQTAIDSTCISCHRVSFDDAPNHVSSNFPQTCEECHNTVGWDDAIFNHDFFPFVGGHSGLGCVACHTSGVYESIPADCQSCHQSDYQEAPGHASGGFPTTCDDCHSLNTWADVDFGHDLFPLTNAHDGVDCVQCHDGGTFGTIPADCISCHQESYQTAPGHVASGFSQTCQDCHATTTWPDWSFDHGAFPLENSHNGLTCAQCHATGVYQTMPNQCVFCHQSDFIEAPSHVASNFPQDCETCHTTTGWDGATFDHSFFPLSGAHNGLQCLACHTSGTYGTIPTDCVSCHDNDYQQAPGHAGSFPTTCEDCHSVTTWGDANFDHSFFPLSGAHNAVQCIACHTSGTYGTIPADCFSCHDNDYQQAPGHAGSFPTTCDDCHQVTTWQNATFDHSIFPLTGGHNGATCQQCHTGGTYGTIPSDCLFCHQADYAEAPSHLASNFSQNCENCHTITVWSSATYDHSFFPLSGGHNGLQCLACHTSGVYATIPANCFSCHQSDYNGAPDHQSLNFPHDCESCHDTSNWQNTNFFHSFPLSGPHGGRDCNECHISGTTEDFSCYGSCHKHGQTQMNDKHRGEPGYAYDFQLCLACHPNGRH